MTHLPLPRGFLLLPPPGDRTARSLRRKVRLLAIRGLLEGGGSLAGPLEAALRSQPDAVLAAVGAPDVLPSLLAARGGVLPASACTASAMPFLLTALHAEGVQPPEPLLIRGAFPHLPGLPGGRRASFDAPARALLLDASGLSVELSDGSHRESTELETTRTSFAIPDAPVEFCIADTNPLSFLEDHPEKHGNAVDLAARPVSEWLQGLGEGFQLIREGLPDWSEELPQTLSRLLPVGYEMERHLSASYGDAPGLAYLTLHPKPLTLAEAIVHETQHGKLNLLLWLDQVLINGRTTWTSSPVRPDLRPLLGVLLAVHAFVPVAALHARLAAIEHPLAHGPEFARRRLDVLAGNEGGMVILREKSVPTRTGRRVLDALERLHAATMALAPAGPISPRSLPPG